MWWKQKLTLVATFPVRKKIKKEKFWIFYSEGEVGVIFLFFKVTKIVIIMIIRQLAGLRKAAKRKDNGGR